MSEQPEPDLGLLWGAENIGAFIGRTERQTKHALAKGELPGRKVCGRWCASREALRQFFTDQARAA